MSAWWFFGGFVLGWAIAQGAIEWARYKERKAMRAARQARAGVKPTRPW